MYLGSVRFVTRGSGTWRSTTFDHTRIGFRASTQPTVAIAISTVIASITLSTPTYGQTNHSTSAAELQPTSPISTTPQNSDYILPPRVAAPEKLHPLTTTLPLNDIPINHFTQWQFSTRNAFAQTPENPIFLNGTLKLEGRVIESLTRNNIYTVDQEGSYWQLRSVTHQTAIATTTVEPQTMNGLEMQMSLIAPCLTSDSSTDQQCTFTPGLVADRSSIDPQLFVPTGLEQISNVGDAVTPESLAAIRQPGFQAGANGQEIGINLYFPNGGTFAGNSQSEETAIERNEKTEYAYAGTFSRIRQIVKANDTEAVLGRTVRGFTVFVEGENPSVNLAIQGAAQLLPEVVPKIEGSQNPVNTRINSILYRAASNARLPAGSFTIYSAGVGRARSLTPDMTSLKQVPRANYNSSCDL
ncbi:MAG: hypothetical protein EBE86_030650 [Hormoscilla sp. GUM202]|nr:hypothetical protein [Hormoscilla sp. GUM202]